tara:strand:- start:2082 stop:2582 length:501 start_codon:yes stop_codon:yes gene_type:complete
MSLLQNILKQKFPIDTEELEVLIGKVIKPLDPQGEPVVDVIATTGHNRGGMGKSGKVEPSIIPKRWGYEKIYQNNKEYCSKLLVINKEQQTSMHFHIDKHETLVVVEGVLAVDYISKKHNTTIFVKPLEAFVIAPGLPHRLRALEEDVKLIESSMPSFDTDSIRIS